VYVCNETIFSPFFQRLAKQLSEVNADNKDQIVKKIRKEHFNSACKNNYTYNKSYIIE
jgi:hypothetical protein